VPSSAQRQEANVTVTGIISAIISAIIVGLIIGAWADWSCPAARPSPSG
jgi:F0F1-type ATP synthase assembly protein I